MKLFLLLKLSFVLLQSIIRPSINDDLGKTRIASRMHEKSRMIMTEWIKIMARQLVNLFRCDCLFIEDKLAEIVERRFDEQMQG